MPHTAEYLFLRSTLKKLRLRMNTISPGEIPREPLDLGIRRSLGMDEEYEYLLRTIPFQRMEKAIYKMTDAFLCSYLFLPLCDTPSGFVIVGPYLTSQLTRQHLLDGEHGISLGLFRQLEGFYNAVPVLADENFLLAAVTAFAERLWDSEAFSVVDLSGELSVSAHRSGQREPPSPDQTLLEMESMEYRYAYENQLLRAVEQGQSNKAITMLKDMNPMALEQRASDPVRNVKNYCIIMNTLFRKAVERGGVHPLYIHSISSDFARRIETVTSAEAAHRLMEHMIHDYCRLVKKYALARYSTPVRRVMACINGDISSDLSLSAMANMLNISPGYLSSIFKKEVGQTLTDYVNSQRVVEAARLLQNGSLQVQAVAQHCGIPDVNYFSKLFKRYTGISPKEFRRTARIGKEQPKGSEV